MFTVSEGEVEQEKLGSWEGSTDFTHFPADLVDLGALPRGGFALFSSNVYRDLINTHAYIINYIISKIKMVGLPIIDFLLIS